MEAASTFAPAHATEPVPPRERTRTGSEAPPQHMRALAHANEVRLARAALKRAVKAGALSVADVVRSCPPEVETMRVSELLCSQQRWGRARARKFLQPLAVGENREVGRLTVRQRTEMARRLEASMNDRHAAAA